jgi:hypothetical protein
MFQVGVGVVLGLLFLWLGYLTYKIWKNGKFLEQLFPQGESRQIRGKLTEVLDSLKEIQEENSLIAGKLDELAQEGSNHIQRVEIMRYNPYNDTGGDQSFTSVLLDGKLNGFMITSLHSRSSTRIYTKIIKSGKSDLELSKEEEEVLKKAIG